MTRVYFESGAFRDIADEDLARRVRALDGDGDLVVPLEGVEGWWIPLTPCCNASGKGSVNVESGVCCRACYADVGPKYGGNTKPTDPRATCHPGTAGDPGGWTCFPAAPACHHAGGCLLDPAGGPPPGAVYPEETAPCE